MLANKALISGEFPPLTEKCMLQVLSWCPKNNPIRKVLGAMKDKTEPVDLKVFPAEVRGGDVFVKID